MNAISGQMEKAIHKARSITLLLVITGFMLVAATCHSEQPAGPSQEPSGGVAAESAGPPLTQNRTIVIQAGHGLGATGAGLCRLDPAVPNIETEAELNEAIARRVVAYLGEVYGSQNVKLYIGKDSDLQGLVADAFVALHADQGLPERTGYKIARHGGDEDSFGLDNSGDASDRLVEALWNEYGAATGLSKDEGHITDDMIEYYGFNWIDPGTPGAIIEMGWLCDDLPLLLHHQDAVALGIARGVTRFLGDDISLIPILPVPDVRVEAMELEGGRTDSDPTELGPSSQPDPLDREDSSSVIQRIQQALQTKDVAVFDLLSGEEVRYAKGIEGVQFVPKQEFLEHLSNSWSSGPYCEAYVVENAAIRIWTKGWEPPWEMTELCYDGCQEIRPPWESDTAAFFLSETSEGWAIETLWLNDRSIWQQLYGTSFTSCDQVQLVSGPSPENPMPGETLQIGRQSVWDVPSNAFPVLLDCQIQATSTADCMEEAMKSRGARPEAIAFAGTLDWQSILVSFSEHGTIDIGVVFYPIRANNNWQMVMLNGVPPVVSAEEAWDLDMSQAPGYETLRGARAELILWASENTLEAVQSLAGGGQRFVFSHPLYKGCHACGTGGYALSAHDFESDGQFIGRTLLGVGSSKPAVPDP